MIHFLISNILISMIIGILLIIKKCCNRTLSHRMQYRLWLLLLGILLVPLIPLQSLTAIIKIPWNTTTPDNTMSAFSQTPATTAANWMNDFTLSVERRTSASIGIFLLCIWVAGMSIVMIRIANAYRKWSFIKKSASTLQHEEIQRLHQHCLEEVHIRRKIPLYQTELLASPVIAGIFRPCIYFPTHLLDDWSTAELRFMLLHELQHHKHKDAFVNILLNLFSILYWFNPFVIYAFKEMKTERELACDCDVLTILNPQEWMAYGYTLINLSEKVSAMPFVSGIGGTMHQMKKRITAIANYRIPDNRQRRRSHAIFAFTTAILLILTPALSAYGFNQDEYHWNTTKETIFEQDFTDDFEGYEGTFVLYDLEHDTWNVHNMNQSTKRTAPNSTFKIYDALFALEEGIITPDQSSMKWDQTLYPFEEWNQDQTLSSAMTSSVNWYFQEIDAKLGKSRLKDYYQEIGYGNADISGSLSDYWMESSLKISAVEQVELLKKMYQNDFGFTKTSIQTVKDALVLTSSEHGTFYGKTGTGRVNGQDISGWFVGFIETPTNVYCFATNILADQHAAGSQASEITWNILAKMGITGH